MAGLTDLRLRLKRMSSADAHALAGLSALRSLDLEARTLARTHAPARASTKMLNLFDRRLQPNAAPGIGCPTYARAPSGAAPLQHACGRPAMPSGLAACPAERLPPCAPCPQGTPLTGSQEALHMRASAHAGVVHNLVSVTTITYT